MHEKVRTSLSFRVSRPASWLVDVGKSTSSSLVSVNGWVWSDLFVGNTEFLKNALTFTVTFQKANLLLMIVNMHTSFVDVLLKCTGLHILQTFRSQKLLTCSTVKYKICSQRLSEVRGINFAETRTIGEVNFAILDLSIISNRRRSYVLKIMGIVSFLQFMIFPYAMCTMESLQVTHVTLIFFYQALWQPMCNDVLISFHQVFCLHGCSVASILFFWRIHCRRKYHPKRVLIFEYLQSTYGVNI